MLTEWLKRLTDGLRRAFGGAPKPAKRFIVHRNGATPPAQQPAARVSAPTRRGGDRFVVASATRPKICPQCRTRDRITRTADSRYECKACGYSWS